MERGRERERGREKGVRRGEKVKGFEGKRETSSRESEVDSENDIGNSAPTWGKYYF